MAGALVRWCVARCGGGGWASPGGRFPALRGASGVRRCPSPGRPSSGVGSQGSVTHVSRVRSVRAWGPSTGPTAGAFHYCEGRLRSGAVPARLPAFWAGRLGPPPTCCGRGRVGVGAQHCPLGLHALRGLHAAGLVGGHPWGGWPATVVRGAVPPPGRPSSGAGSQGSASRVSRVRSVRAWGPSTGPKACAFAGWRCSLWGWRKGVPWGGAFHDREGSLGSGAVPSPTAHPLSGLLGSTVHVLWAQVCGCGGPTLSPWPACPVGAPRTVCPACGRCGRGDPAPAPQRAPLRAGVARCGCGGRASPGGVLSTVVRGARRQALSLPRPPVLWSRQSGFRVPCVPGAVGAGVGTQHRPHSRGHKKSKRGIPTRASKHKQGMAKEHKPKPAAAIATGTEGPRTDYGHEVHNAARGNAMKTTPHPLSIGHQRGRKPPTPEKMWTPPKNTRRTRSGRHRRTEHEWY